MEPVAPWRLIDANDDSSPVEGLGGGGGTGGLPPYDGGEEALGIASLFSVSA